MTTDEMKELIVNALGYEQAFEEITKGMSSNEERESYEYIIKMWDLKE